MTREEFFEGYCARSSVPVEQARAWGWHAEPCACDHDGCRGWQMVTNPRAVWDPNAEMWVEDLYVPEGEP